MLDVLLILTCLGILATIRNIRQDLAECKLVFKEVLRNGKEPAT